MSFDLLDLPYQDEGAAFLSHKERAGLYDEPGLGKTRQTIKALDTLKLVRGVIICPASARQVWIGEFLKFSAYERQLRKARHLGDLQAFIKGDVDILIMSYEKATDWASRLGGDVLDFVICDESHYLKTKGTKRTAAILGHECDGRHGLARWARYVWFLSGTPAPNDPSDTWTIMRFCRATRLTERIFQDRYFKKHVGTYSSSFRLRDEVLNEYRQSMSAFSLRRTGDQVGLQLPPVWFSNVTIDGDDAEVLALMRLHPGLEDAIVKAVELGGLRFLEAPHIATLRRLVAEAKAPAYVELLADELADGLDKVLVFGIHRKAMDTLQQGFEARGIQCVRVDGSTSERGRVDAVAEFRTNPKCRLFLGNIKAAGTALTLVEANHVDMFESEWEPTSNAQALKRVHRIGQRRDVHARFITLAESVDDAVAAIVARKTAELVKSGTFSNVAA